MSHPQDQAPALPGAPHPLPATGSESPGVPGAQPDGVDDKEIQRRLLELETENQELRLLSSRLTHEVRTQIRTIDGMGAILLGQPQLETDSVRLLKLIRCSAARLGHAIDDLHTLAQAAYQPLRLETIDLTALAESIATVLYHANPMRHVQFTVNPHMRAKGDAVLLRLALTHLISNAWKFTRKRGVGEIEVGQQILAGKITYFVRDNGAGFDMAYAGRLFEPFARLHRQEEFDGTGVGLALVRKVMERHQGKVWAQAKEGEGATFFFSLESEG